MKRVLTSVILLMAVVSAIMAGEYKSFKVSIYTRAYEVAKMADEHWLDSTWQVITQQLKVDKIYLETHRDLLIVPDETLQKAKKYFEERGLEVCGGITYTISEPNLFETFSYSNPEHRRKVQEIAEHTAKNFDEFIPDDFGQLYDYPQGALRQIRRVLSQDLPAYLDAPAKVSLFLYDNNTMVVENFNDEPVTVSVVMSESQKELRDLMTSEVFKAVVPQLPGNRFYRNGQPRESNFTFVLPPHSYKALTAE